MSHPPTDTAPSPSADASVSDAPAAAAAPPARPSRRDFFRLGALASAGAAATAAAPAAALAQAARTAAQPRPRRLARNIAGVNEAAQSPFLLDPAEEWENWALRLARRVTMGLTDEEARRARRLGYYGYLDYQLDHEAIDDSAVETFVATKWPTTKQTGVELFSQDSGMVQTQLQESFLYRATFSKRQLFQRMVEFWSDHFTIYLPKVGYLKTIDDREVIRKHALGKFPDLLRASAKSTAMLVFLDQQVSRRGAPNQNYARELMELHTLGVDGGYTQNDVAELSRILTGWTIAGRGDFAFNPALHDYTQKVFLGRTFPATESRNFTNPDGIKEGEQVLDMLVAHPSTATFVSTKLLRHLLWYDPTPAMVARVAAVYTRTGGDIKAMVRQALSFENLSQAPAKLKRPFHFVVSALRASNPTTVTGVAAVNRMLVGLGQPLFQWLTPDGYPDQIEYWAGNLLPRWNAATTIANLAAGELAIDVTPLTRLGTAEAVVQEIGRMAFGGELQDRLREELVFYLKPQPTSATRIRETLALAFASSPFQWY